MSRVTKKSPRQEGVASPRCKKKSGVLADHEISHATARANAGAWWPCWPSMVGHESRRPAAKPRLGSGVPHASVSAGVESACPWPASTRAATVPPVRTPWLGLGQALTPNQISDAAARANAGAWLGPGTHPSGLGVPNAHNGPCPKPAAYPYAAEDRSASSIAPLRPVRNATCQPSGAARCRAAVLGNRMWWRPSA